MLCIWRRSKGQNIVQSGQLGAGILCQCLAVAVCHENYLPLMFHFGVMMIFYWFYIQMLCGYCVLMWKQIGYPLYINIFGSVCPDVLARSISLSMYVSTDVCFLLSARTARISFQSNPVTHRPITPSTVASKILHDFGPRGATQSPSFPNRQSTTTLVYYFNYINRFSCVFFFQLEFSSIVYLVINTE